MSTEEIEEYEIKYEFGVRVKYIINKTTKIEKPNVDDEDDLKWLRKESFTGDYSNGFLTFNCEGNDIENSAFFTRKPHVPKNKTKNIDNEAVNFGTKDNPKYFTTIGKSGITIGRGLDMGGRTNRESEIILVNISKNNRCKPLDNALKKWLVESSGKIKKSALEYLLSLEKLDIQLITRKQQFYLFHEVYPKYIDRAKNKLKDSDIDLNKCTQKVQDVLVDMDYVGHMGDSRKIFCSILKNDLKKNNYDGFKNYLSEKYKEKNDLRWKQRMDYLTK